MPVEKLARARAVSGFPQPDRSPTRRVGDSDGLLGVVFACQFLRPDFGDDANTPNELITRHAAYVPDRIGAEHVALGSALDGAMMPAGVRVVAGVPRVLDGFLVVCFGEDDLKPSPGVTGVACSTPGGANYSSAWRRRLPRLPPPSTTRLMTSSSQRWVRSSR